MLSKASGSCVRTWKGNSSGKTKRTHFQEPRGLVQGFVLMTRDSTGVPLLRGSCCTPRCSLRGALGFIHWESACKALAGKSDPRRKHPHRDLVVTASPRSSCCALAALTDTDCVQTVLQTPSSGVKMANARSFCREWMHKK